MVWYKERFRRNLVDMHIEDWDSVFLSEFDPDKYVELLKLGHINAPMLYFQSHVGLCYWPTKSGKMHSGFIGREDAMKQVERKCHEAGMNVIAYYSLIYNNWAYGEHPEWRMRNLNGEGSRANGNRYGLCCPNSQEYRAFVEEQVRELCEYFDFESIFFDMTFWPMVCYCDHCRARWEREVGGEMPAVIDWRDPRWLRFQEKRSEWIGEFALWATATLKKFKPDSAVEHQYSPIMHYWRFGVDENITKACTYAGGDLYGGISEQSFACKLYYGITQDQPFEYMTSRCYPALSEHTTTKSRDLLTLSVMTTFAHHGACLLIDAIDPVGTMDRRVYETIGEIFKETEPLERYLTWGRLAYDVALYYDLNSKYDVEMLPGSVLSEACANDAMPHRASVLSAARSLREHHLPYGVISNWKLTENLQSAKVAVFSDVQAMTDEQANMVLDYVRGGGKIYVSGHTSPRLLSEIFGLKFEGFTEENVTYISPTDAGEAMMEGAFTAKYPMALFERQAVVSGTPRGEVLGTMTLPYTVPNAASNCTEPFFARESAGDGELPEETVRFASIHSNPPGRYTNQPALVRARYGQGEAIWCAAPFERANREQHSDIFARLIRSMVHEPLFTAQAPESVECVLFDAPERSAKLITILNLQDSFHTQPVYNFSVSIASEREPKAVRLIPDACKLEFNWDRSYATFNMDQLRSYAMIVIEY